MDETTRLKLETMNSSNLRIKRGSTLIHRYYSTENTYMEFESLYWWIETGPMYVRLSNRLHYEIPVIKTLI